MKRIFLILVLLAAVLLGGSWYVHRARIRALNSGDVFVREQAGSNAVPLPPPASQPGQPSTPSQPASPNPAAVASPAAANPSPPTSAPSTPSAASAPASDSIVRNPPNGMLFTGSGKYQLYRQGDITWRLNTDTGWACVLFATDAQWRKTRVYREGCRAFNEAAPLRGY